MTAEGGLKGERRRALAAAEKKFEFRFRRLLSLVRVPAMEVCYFEPRRAQRAQRKRRTPASIRRARRDRRVSIPDLQSN